MSCPNSIEKSTQRIHRQHFLADFVAPFVVHEHNEPSPRTDAVVVATGRADVLVLFQVGLVQHTVAGRAFDPQAFGHGTPVFGVGVLNFGGKQFFEPTHLIFSRLALSRRVFSGAL